MGVQSILEEVDFDNEELAALKSSKEGAAKSRWVMVWLWGFRYLLKLIFKCNLFGRSTFETQC